MPDAPTRERKSRSSAPDPDFDWLGQAASRQAPPPRTQPADDWMSNVFRW